MISALAVLIAANLASAHFSVDYPEWRGDSLKNVSYSQYVYPCKFPSSPRGQPLPSKQLKLNNSASLGAGVPGNTGNRTDWPLNGGSLKLDLHHPWTYGTPVKSACHQISPANPSLLSLRQPRSRRKRDKLQLHPHEELLERDRQWHPLRAITTAARKPCRDRRDKG